MESGRLVAAVPLQLPADHLVEEAAVAHARQRVGDDELAQVVLGRLQPPVGAAQLVGHVLEGHQLHAERGQQEDHEDHQQDCGRSGSAESVAIQAFIAAKHSSIAPTSAAPSSRARRAEEQVGDAGRRHGAGDEEEARRENGDRPERRGRQREPDRDRQQQDAVDAPQPRRLPVRVGRDDEQQPRQQPEELRDAERHRVELRRSGRDSALSSDAGREERPIPTSTRGCRAAAGRCTGGAAASR